MTQPNVVPIKTPIAKARRPSKAARLANKQRIIAIADLAVALVLIVLSLDHLARGIGWVTLNDGWEPLALAIGFDLSYIVMEAIELSVTDEKTRKLVLRITRPTIYFTIFGSAALNAYAFAAPVMGWMIIPAALLGAVISGLIYQLVRAGVILWTRS